MSGSMALSNCSNPWFPEMEREGTPVIEVGILRARTVRFRLEGRFLKAGIGEGRRMGDSRSRDSRSGDSRSGDSRSEDSRARTLLGRVEAEAEDGSVILSVDGEKEKERTVLRLDPEDPLECSFILEEVTIGIGFHWQQTEDQQFRGSLMLAVEGSELQVVNIVDVETYLVSVISSEMSSGNSPEFLKAHAIISRSWLMAQIEKVESRSGQGQKKEPLSGQKQKEETRSGRDSKKEIPASPEEEHIRWHDREEHESYLVCADDHCQRYQGITRTLNPQVEVAVKETTGSVLTHGGKVCDTRYSKCCGGVVELFESCWEPVPRPYLQRVEDHREPGNLQTGDLRVEELAVRFIKDRPGAFCNTRDPGILEQVLNEYDLRSGDFFRWEVAWSQQQVSDLISERSGTDFGRILDLLPVERGVSGRLVRMRIVGTKRSLVIGKELEIRRWLSPSHLYSSAFYVEKKDVVDGVPGSFILKGAGWGHGVGLCQVGAAVMASEGYSHGEILSHYFPETEMATLY